MADLILPDSRWEQPDLLYPNRKPVGNVKVDEEHWFKPRNLWGFGTLCTVRGDRTGESFGTSPARLNDYYRTTDLHGYNLNGSNEPEISHHQNGSGIAYDGNASDFITTSSETDTFGSSTAGTFFVVFYVDDVTNKSNLIGGFNGSQTPIRTYGYGICIEGGTIYGTRSVNNTTQHASTTISVGRHVAAVCLDSGILSVDGRSSTGSLAASGTSYPIGVGEAAHVPNAASNRARLDGFVYLAGTSELEYSEAQLNGLTSSPYQFLVPA